MSDRLGCCVPFCRRTTKRDCSEWVCGPHWAAVPTLLKKRKYKLFRLYKRRFGTNGYWAYPAGSPNRLLAVRLERLCEKAWKRCKRAAIETAAGI
jgi:hypothetical protein